MTIVLTQSQSSVTDPAAVFADHLFPMFVERHLLYILFRLYRGSRLKTALGNNKNLNMLS